MCWLEIEIVHINRNFLEQNLYIICLCFISSCLRKRNMWSCKPHILLLSLLAINMADVLISNRPSTIMVDGLVTASAPSQALLGLSRRRQLWGIDGVRALARDLDPLTDSSDLPSCVEMCITSTCTDFQPAGTDAPTTIPGSGRKRK